MTTYLPKAVTQVAQKITSRCGIDDACEGVVIPAYKALGRAKLQLGIAHFEMAQEIFHAQKSSQTNAAINGIQRAMDTFLSSLTGSVSAYDKQKPTAKHLVPFSVVEHPQLPLL